MRVCFWPRVFFFVFFFVCVRVVLAYSSTAPLAKSCSTSSLLPSTIAQPRGVVVCVLFRLQYYTCGLRSHTVVHWLAKSERNHRYFWLLCGRRCSRTTHSILRKQHQRNLEMPCLLPLYTAMGIVCLHAFSFPQTQNDQPLRASMIHTYVAHWFSCIQDRSLVTLGRRVGLEKR